MSDAPRLQIADLRGNSLQRGRQHGEMFAEKIRKSGIVDFYHAYCEKELLLHAPNSARRAFRLLHTLCASRQSPHARSLISGFGQASGFDEKILARCVSMPDALNYLIGLNGKLTGAVPALGCTSAAVWGDYSQDGRFLYARNLDFPGNGFWDQHALLTRNKPDQGIPYVSIGTAGNMLDAVTGINEEGLSVAIHQHLSTDVGIVTGGKPILNLALQILQFARSTDEAVRLASGWKTTSGWTLVLTHWKERRACLLEITPRRMAVHRFSEGKMVRSNDYLDPALKKNEIDYPCWRESSRLRAFRADQIIEQNKGRVDAEILARLLSDHLDADRGRLRAFTQAIAQPHNMTSVVFEPERGIAWIAEGKAPVNAGSYRKVALWENAQPDELLKNVADPLSPKHREAFNLYLDAYSGWQKIKDPAAALPKLGQTAAGDPEEPVYRYMHGLFALKCGDPESAADSFGAGAAMPDYHHRSSAQRLWQARCLDLLGKRGQALPLYRDLAQSGKIKPRVRRAAEQGLARPYAGKNIKTVMPDFFIGDVFRY